MSRTFPLKLSSLTHAIELEVSWTYTGDFDEGCPCRNEPRRFANHDELCDIEDELLSAHVTETWGDMLHSWDFSVFVSMMQSDITLSHSVSFDEIEITPDCSPEACRPIKAGGDGFQFTVKIKECTGFGNNTWDQSD
jgi:hypothetical protein